MGAPVEVTHNFQVDFVWKSTSFDRYVHLVPARATASALGCPTASGIWMILLTREGQASPLHGRVHAADPELAFQDAECAENVCRG